jgi:REP element-mobilizing transposase RayT
MDESQEHTRWNCRYHIVWAPKFQTENYLWEVSERDRGDNPKIMRL